MLKQTGRQTHATLLLCIMAIISHYCLTTSSMERTIKNQICTLV